MIAPYNEDDLQSRRKLVWDQISDINAPTLNDLKILQKYLVDYRDGGIIKLVGDRYVDFNLGQLKILNPENSCEGGIIAVNCDNMARENCLITYATYNMDFAQKVRRLVKHVKETDYKGHILFRIGGWPNTECGDLKIAHVPYAFKVSMFREAQRLGFKHVLWLDSCIIPIISLNDVFDVIKKNGYYVEGNTPHMVRTWSNTQSVSYFGLTLEAANSVPSCSANIFGLILPMKKAPR